MSSPLRIVFMGSDPIALPLLHWLSGEAARAGLTQVVAVYTQPDRAVGRGQKVQANDIKLWAQEQGVPVYQPDKITDETLAELAALQADISLVMAYGHILRDTFIETPKLGTLNLHASLLPSYRGASPIQTAVANGESETGVSLMRIVRRLDAGPVADVERVCIAPLDTALEIEQKLAAACVPLLERTLPALRMNALNFKEQDEARATFCRRLVKDDGRVDFSAPAAVLAARINGLFPWPACSVEINGQPVKLGLADVDIERSAEAERASAGSAGVVLGHDEAGLYVATGSGVLRVRKLQRPGGKMLAASEFLRGFPIAAGTVLPSRPLPLLVDSKPFPYRKI